MSSLISIEREAWNHRQERIEVLVLEFPSVRIHLFHLFHEKWFKQNRAVCNACALIYFYCNPTIVATNLENIVTNDPTLNNLELAPCNHEEADTWLLLHVLSGSSCGYKKISIVTVDTDVVVISLYHFFSMDLEELWIEFGTGRNKRYFPIHQLANSLSEEVCRALPFWSTFTGCDTVSMFAGQGEKWAWKCLGKFPRSYESFC